MRTVIARRCISAILFDVRNILGVVALAFGISVVAPFAVAQAPAQQEPQGNQQQTPQGALPPAQQTPLPPNQAPAPAGPVIVLNPAHGGTDTGARGQNAAMEKDLVLQMARGVKAELERQGFRVVMTRNDDSNPSYDDRAAIANAYSDAIFVSLHIASTGTAGTIRAYYDQLSTPYVPPNETADTPAKAVPRCCGTEFLERGAARVSEFESSSRRSDPNHARAEIQRIAACSLGSGSARLALRRRTRSGDRAFQCVRAGSRCVGQSAAAPLGEAIAGAVTAFRAATPGGAKQ